MSVYFSVKSRGYPYFAAAQNNLAFMDAAHAPKVDFNIGESGVIALEFAVHSLPVPLVSEDETHQLFSYHEYGPGGANIVYVGVSPNGRLIAFNKGSAAELRTAPGYIVADGVFRKHMYSFQNNADYISGWDWQDGVAGSNVVQAGPGLPFSSYASTAFVGPSGTKLGRIMLFNSKEAITKCACSMRYAVMLMGAVPGQSGIMYDFSEGHGTSLEGAQVEVIGPDFALDPTLTIQYYDPQVYPLLYGGIPTDSVNGAFQWDRRTRYTRRMPAAVSYRRVS